jgi:hypothetical protein
MGPVPLKTVPLYAGVVHFRLPGSGPMGRGGRGGMGPVPLKTVPLNASGTQRKPEFGGVGRGGRGGIGAPPLPVSVDLRLFETGGWGGG